MTGSDSFFDALKAKRESQNIEISEICEFTKINPRYIEAIEKGDFTTLPNVYTRLFLRAYANFIGTDSAKALKDYELYTTGKIIQNIVLTNNDADTAPTVPPILETETDSNPQISPKQIASGIGVIIAIFILLWWAGRVTDEQTKNIESRVDVIEDSVPENINGLSKQNSQSIVNQGLNVETINKTTSLRDKSPLNDNDFLPTKIESEITQLLNLSPPYTISIKTLQETKLNISKIENTEIIELINQLVPSDKEFIFEFTTTLNFEFWSSNHIKVKLNTTSIDNFLKKDNRLIRGSYEAKKSQLYLSFYKP